MNEIRKEQAKDLLIWTIVMLIFIIVTVFYIIPPPNEEPTEFEKEFGFDYSTRFDARAIALIISVLVYIKGAFWLLYIVQKRNKKKQPQQSLQQINNITVKYCGNCGKQLQINSSFCDKCGYKY